MVKGTRGGFGDVLLSVSPQTNLLPRERERERRTLWTLSLVVFWFSQSGI